MTLFVENEGADIAYDLEGSGPLMVLIPGGNGDSALFGPLMRALSARFTVVKIDRRAAGRSTGDPQAELDLMQAARDVAAVIVAVKRGRAIVFGSSAGGVIALRLAQDRPDLIDHLLVHEPPVTEVLPEPEAGRWRAFNQKVGETFRGHGTGPAMRLFASTMVGFENEEMPGDQKHETSDRFFLHEFHNINSFTPDMVRLRATGVVITMLIGAASGDAYYVGTARYLARHLPCDLRVVPGHHVGYAFDPSGFADGIAAALV